MVGNWVAVSDYPNQIFRIFDSNLDTGEIGLIDLDGHKYFAFMNEVIMMGDSITSLKDKLVANIEEQTTTKHHKEKEQEQ